MCYISLKSVCGHAGIVKHDSVAHWRALYNSYTDVEPEAVAGVNDLVEVILLAHSSSGDELTHDLHGVQRAAQDRPGRLSQSSGPHPRRPQMLPQCRKKSSVVPCRLQSSAGGGDFDPLHRTL